MSASKPQHPSLLELVDQRQSQGINDKGDRSFTGLLKKTTPFVESDVDEELILDMYFVEQVSLSGLKITATDADSAPKRIRVFVNRDDVSFENGSSLTAAFESDLTAASLAAGCYIPLRIARFQRVSNITIFVQSNHGAETTRIHGIDVFGIGAGTTNMSDLKKVEHSHA
ncbi:hypothetical protein H696_01353 [Fonticula alba]|uniref:PITH domain-containing protein n=1 Tax=Fonticula alba TaxID=691883 RepID=A0A058ZC05_FONAL|nr:hypothetical protein H696_01353 [Fonticula alba]KCV71944.1 hypothetical protein H696_01353 [Fonticula alba]|eukprot:XP_009493522.1 hypothetical protein H696_01353 [Fonticula alba]